MQALCYAVTDGVPSPIERGYLGADALFVRVPAGPSSTGRVEQALREVGYPVLTEHTGPDLAVLIPGLVPAFYPEAMRLIAAHSSLPHCTVNRGALKAAVAKVIAAVSSRSTLPILHNIYLEHDGQTLKLSATDLEVGVQVTIPAMGDGFRTTVPARVFKEVVNGDKDVSLTLEVDDSQHEHSVEGRMYVSGQGSTELPTLPADEFPVIPAVEGEVITLPPDVWQVAEDCLISVSTDETRTRLCGQHWFKEDGNLRIDATQTHTLTTHSVACELPAMVGEDRQPYNVIIPAKSIRTLLKLLPRFNRQVEHMVTDNRAVWEWFDGDIRVRVTSRLLEGEFPNYRKVVMYDAPVRAMIDPAEWIAAVKACNTVARDNNQKIHLTIAPDCATLEAFGRGVTVTRQIPGEFVHGPEYYGEPVTLPFTIAFNGAYLLSILGTLRGPAYFGLVKPNQPAVFRTAEIEHMIMPMSIG